ncbi:hypothetical protein JXA85_05540, partial [Candidatus Woesearchaeota archaeon]|nr:hypothetical protein [Candidatus Woesearchaeota archaeon]
MEHEEHADEHPKHSSHKHQKKNGYKVVRHVKVDHDKGKVIVKKECFWKTLTIIIGIAFVVLILALALRKPATQGGKYTGEKAKVEFYVMSQCPYGIQVENGIKPVLDKFGDAIDFQLNFIVNDNGDGTFQSLHGQNEVMGNIVQLCAAKHEPNKFMDMIFCMNKNSGAIPANWEQCAKDSGLDVAKIKTCFEGVEGKQLLSESARKTDMVGATGSPTMFIGEQDYNGGRDEVSFTRAV